MNGTRESEAARQAELDSFQIVDTFEEQAYDDLARLAASTFNTPIALITFLDNDRNWFKSRVGLSQTEVQRSLSLCNHLLFEPESLLVIPDASIDPRFQKNPLVAGETGIRFYAGAPLLSSAGHVLGAICAIDTVPRQADPDKLEMLQFLAQQVIELLEQRRRPVPAA